jgi:hypothetical protein
MGEISLTLAYVVDIEPTNFRQVFEEKQQLRSMGPISSTFQQMGGIRNVANGNFARRCRPRRKEVYEAVVIRIRRWVKDEAFNGLLTLVEDQRGQIEVSAAIRIKEEVMHQNMVPKDIFVFHLLTGTN